MAGAKLSHHHHRLILLLLILTLAAAKPAAGSFARTLNPQKLRLKPETLTHLHFYFHDIVSGRHPTAVRIARAAATNASRSAFGLVMMMDDPLTAGPDPGSRLVGRAQGVYGSASMSELSFLMVLNFVFLEGELNGSSVSVLGRNSVFSGVREMPVVGGSGVFRFGRGYVEARTHEVDLVTGNAVVEYNGYVFHPRRRN